MGLTPQDFPQESLWGGVVSSYMVVQQRLADIHWLDSTSRLCWMLPHGTYYGKVK